MAAQPETRPLVFDHLRGDGIVAVEHRSSKVGPDVMIVYRRSASGALTSESQPFEPFLWLAGTNMLSGYSGTFQTTQLSGENPLGLLATFDTWAELQGALKHLRSTSGRTASDREAPYFVINQPVQQHLMRTGQTLFRGMTMNGVRRLQIDIETHCEPEFEFPNADRETDRILALAMSDNTGWDTVLSAADMDEATMLRRFVEIVLERDPDVLEGHNLFNFDLPYIEARAKRHKVKLALGRDGSLARSRPSRYVVADQVVAYSRYEIHGRHVVDTFVMAQAYDATHRALESLSLKDIAVHLGLASGDRTYIEGREIAATFAKDPARVIAYARDDILETRAISNVFSPSYFTQAQLLPFSYQDIVIRGSGAKIDAMLLREYLHAGWSVPLLEPAREFAGGYTDVFFTGVAHNVHHCDVRSLYPSLMLLKDVGPAHDHTRIFLRLLSRLRDVRVEAKRRMNIASSPEERVHHDALQTTYKILINSFYGYLGFSQGRFNDYDAAERVASEGRQLLGKMIDWLRKHGATPIEIDTDGIYFVPPELLDDAALDEFRKQMISWMPQGIDLEFDGVYVSMLSYKMKNYALLAKDGSITIKGAALKSRGLEPFQRDYIRNWIRFTLEDRPDAIAAMNAEYRTAVSKGLWDIRRLAKTETLQDSPATYAAKIGGKARGRNAAYELALKSDRPYRAGDQITYYVTGTRKSVAVYEAAKPISAWNPDARDENIAYYLSKLESLIEKFGGIATGEGTNEQELSLGL